MELWVARLDRCISQEPVMHQSLLWELARLTLLHGTLLDVVTSLETFLTDSSAASVQLESFTSGVSFVKQTESHQLHVTDTYTALPPIVIQPPSSKRIQSPQIAEMVQTIISDEVLLVRMPDRDDFLIKSYLLNRAERQTIAKFTPGALCQVINGLGPSKSSALLSSCHT